MIVRSLILAVLIRPVWGLNFLMFDDSDPDLDLSLDPIRYIIYA